VVAEPGMGKSITTTQVAWHTKLADPTSWVVRINWNDHTGKLEDINASKFNLDTVVEFPCSTAFPKSEYTDINRNLLKQALQNSGNVTVLMDGFDNIRPIHADKAAVILSKLMKTKVRRVWVTVRPVQRERLEKEPSVAAFSMKKTFTLVSSEYAPGTLDTQINPDKEACVAFINQVLKLINHSINDRKFIVSPL